MGLRPAGEGMGYITGLASVRPPAIALMSEDRPDLSPGTDSEKLATRQNSAGYREAFQPVPGQAPWRKKSLVLGYLRNKSGCPLGFFFSLWEKLVPLSFPCV